MKTWPIGLIWNSPDPLPEEFPAVAAALQRQVVEHFAPRWGATATVDALKGIAHVGDRIPIFVQKKLQQRLAGYDLAGARPFARVVYDGGWSVTASHGRSATPAAGHVCPGRRDGLRLRAARVVRRI